MSARIYLMATKYISWQQIYLMAHGMGWHGHGVAWAEKTNSGTHLHLLYVDEVIPVPTHV